MDSFLGGARTRRLATVVAAVIAVTSAPGCRPVRVTDAPATTGPVSASTGETFTVDAAASQLHVLVYRAGALSRLGHNHVVAAQGITGRILRAPTVEASSVEMFLPVSRFIVDSAPLRARYGEAFASMPSEADIEGTTANMLGTSLLDAASYAQIRIAGRLARTESGYAVEADINVKNTVLHRTIPIELELEEERIVARGRVELEHGELGLTPFSVMLGALRVADTIEINFSLVANRTDRH